MPSQRVLLLVFAAFGAVALSGCFEVRENAEPVDDEVNNAGQTGGGEAPLEDGDGPCIHTTTGEPTADPAANPCPQGQYPAGG